MSQSLPAAAGDAVQRIRGVVGPKVMSKSHELFRGDLVTIAQELFQNARRAGARRIDVEHLRGPNGGALTIRDDGRGLNDFQHLLTFGGSGWSEGLQEREHSAGMGFFSCASRGALVRSRGRRVNLEPAVFRGEAETCVLADPSAPGGTEVTVPLGADSEWVARAVRKAARYLPVAVTLDGVPVEQGDLLAGAQAVVEWDGVRIGVMRDDGAPWDYNHLGWRNLVNFHGVVAGFEHQEDSVRVREQEGTSWSARFDVVDAPDLSLVLPTREWVIVSGFARVLLGHAWRAVYAHIASRPEHGLAFRDAQRARAMGVAMPDATVRLRRWPHPAWEPDQSGPVQLTGDDPTLVVVEDLAHSDIVRANVGQFIEQGGADGAVFVQGHDAWTGYVAYDRLARLERLDATAVLPDSSSVSLRADEGGDAEAQDAALTAMAAACGHEDITTIVATSVAITATIRDRPEHPGQPGAVRTWSAETGLAFTVEADCCPMDETGLITAASTPVRTVAEALVEYFHHPDDDRDSGSYEQQAEWAREAAYERARSALLPPAEAKLRTLLDEALAAASGRPCHADHHAPRRTGRHRPLPHHGRRE